MYVKKIVKLMKKDEGSGLILALMTLMVLSILGASLGAITIGSYKLGDVNRDDNSAYYIAEAGANLAYDEIETIINETYKNSSSSDSFFGSAKEKINNYFIDINYRYNSFDSQFGELPEAIITLEIPDNGVSRDFKITSVGIIGQRKRTVKKLIKVNWIDKNTDAGAPTLPGNTAFAARNKIRFLGGSINGDIYLDSVIEKSFVLGSWGEVKGDIFLSEKVTNVADIYEGPGYRISKLINIEHKTVDQPFPWEYFDNLYNQIKLPSYEDFVILPSYYYNEIEGDSYLGILNLVSDKNINLRTNDKNLNIVVDKLDMRQGHINIIGSGKVNIYIKDTFTIEGSSSINKSGNTGQLNLYYFGANEITLGNDNSINGNVFIEKSNINMNGSGNIKGALVSGGKEVKLNNGASVENTVIIATQPGSQVILNNGISVKGMIIADYLDIQNAYLMYQPFDLNNLPFTYTSSGTTTKPTLEELISSKPALE